MATDYPVTMAVRVLRQHRVEFTAHLYTWEAHGGTRASAQHLGVDEHQVIKTLIFEDEAKKPLCILMHGDREVSAKNLARQIGVKQRRALRARGGRPPLRLPGGRHLALRSEARHAGLLAKDASASWRASTSTAARAASWWASIRATWCACWQPTAVEVAIVDDMA